MTRFVKSWLGADAGVTLNVNDALVIRLRLPLAGPYPSTKTAARCIFGKNT